MTPFALIDTDIIIDIGRGETEAINYLNALSSEDFKPAISSITLMELIVGCRNKAELQQLEHFLAHFKVFHTTQGISRLATNLLSKYRLSHGLLIPDCLIACTAIHFDLTFHSKNQRDFRFIDELKLQPYF